MSRTWKTVLAVLAVCLCALLLDTAQAKLMNNRPLVRITEDYNGGSVYQKDHGMLVYTYVFTDGTRKTVFHWEKYAPPEQAPVDALPETAKNQA